MNNRQVRKLREAFRLLYAALDADLASSKHQEVLDHMRFELERKHRIELYLEDLHDDLDPPDDETEVPPFDAALAAWLEQNDYTILDWYEGVAAVREESEAALGCKFDDRGRRKE
jgi:hypothetical protein